MPFAETLFLDCDIVLFSDPAPWFARLGTDDLTYFQSPVRADATVDVAVLNRPNPHRMREMFGVESVPIIDGSGHFFIRRTDRARELVARIVEIMEEAMDDGPRSLYWRMAGEGNIPCSDELAAAIVMVEMGVQVPAPSAAGEKPLAMFMPPFQRDEHFDFAGGRAEFLDTWSGRRIRPDAVHFAGSGKHHRGYQEWIAECSGVTVRPVAARP